MTDLETNIDTPEVDPSFSPAIVGDTSSGAGQSGGGASTSDPFGVFKFMFNFDGENKGRVLNMLQYTLLTIIPAVLILRGVKYIFPEEDDSKGSFELVGETVGQIMFIMLSIWFTHRLIHYIPTYSGVPYPRFNETTTIISFMLILATMQTKLGAKINILVDRVVDMWHGKSQQIQKQTAQGQGQGVHVMQPLAPSHQPSAADYLDRSQLLPSNPMLSAMPTQLQQPRQDFNQMYQNTPTPMVNAASPGMGMEPMAANDGGSSWGTW